MKVVTFNLVFWNLGRTNNPSLVRDCIVSTDADVALFAEWGRLDLDALASLLSEEYAILPSMSPDAKVIAVFKKACGLTIRREQSRYAIYSYTISGRQFVLAGVHLPDKRSHPNDAARRATSQKLVEDVRNDREYLSCNDAVIIGDFNAEPYDEIMLTPDVFNAVYFKDVISRSRYRIWQGKKFEYLYNPMLCNYSEVGPQYGSFYCSNNDLETYWHCIDQVLVTPGLSSAIKAVRHLRAISGESLLATYTPRKSTSDHLPLCVEFFIE